jgi:hypothetical protein
MFVDNSNVIGGAQQAGRAIENAPWQSVRIYWRNFFEFIEADYLPVTRVFAGSLPPGNEELWQYARDYGYDTSLLHRIEQDDGRLTEQAVDEVLHLKIAEALLDFEAPQTLVLVTGDGKVSNFGTSFLGQAQRAIKRGWRVDVISWRANLSRRYIELEKANPDAVEVVYLDDVYQSVTFLRPIEYNLPDGTTATAKERVVAPLPR